jgi:hypothetical protein
MRKKGNLWLTPGILLVFGMVLAACEHGPGPVVTEGVAIAGVYTGQGNSGHLLRIQDNGAIQTGTFAVNEDDTLKVDRNGRPENDWNSQFSKVTLGNETSFNDTNGFILGRWAFVQNGDGNKLGIAAQVYQTDTALKAGINGVYIGIGSEGVWYLQNNLLTSVFEKIDPQFFDDGGTASMSNRPADLGVWFVGK